ncbi:glycerophosphodiester phosphodiesterase family protein [Aliiruegeria sabulilitoris]|uniref:glycerophosphodiester phosphodiesterase family protein n=1 Tax=Aliiruegeria sabulilitoris TaxID=1510458 RepID=UPI00083452B9|nr:glycerophosphodiester phosphodiesterase family protein [Aliiruegeria sabulilitoris]NDR56447.1 glycerophosphodiester phosphodiesterase family protein [Pseudoruegeria sp. M32A2M]
MRGQFVFLIATIAAVLGFPVAQAESQVTVEARLAPGQPTAIMAHRSAEIGGLPENSLAWIEGAIARGVDLVHINPQLTADDRYILMHDHSLNRMTNVVDVFPDGPPNGPTREQRGGKDYVRDYTLAEIKKLQLVTDDEGASHPVPTLQEALDLAEGRVLVAIGLKSYEVESLARALEGHDKRTLLLWELFYSGTDQSKLKAATDATGIGAVVVLFRSRDYLADLEQIVGQMGTDLRMISVVSAGLTPSFLDRMTALGLPLMISGWNGPEDRALLNEADIAPWKAALEVGLVASTDYPELLLYALGR